MPTTLDQLFVGCPVRYDAPYGREKGIVLAMVIEDNPLDPCVLFANPHISPVWVWPNQLEIIHWDEPEKVSRLIHKQMLDGVSNG